VPLTAGSNVASARERRISTVVTCSTMACRCDQGSVPGCRIVATRSELLATCCSTACVLDLKDVEPSHEQEEQQERTPQSRTTDARSQLDVTGRRDEVANTDRFGLVDRTALASKRCNELHGRHSRENSDPEGRSRHEPSSVRRTPTRPTIRASRETGLANTKNATPFTTIEFTRLPCHNEKFKTPTPPAV